MFLRASTISGLGNEGFDSKKAAIDEPATLETTCQVLKYSTWGKEQIDDRQQQLADLAIGIWSLEVR
ncbi:MAG TPA: DUF1524 domain-containing protein [Pirellulales bacterium]